MQKKWLAGAAIALGSFVLPVTTAGADPKPAFEVTLNCGDHTVNASVAGNGDWSPAHDLNSTSVGVPIAFGEFNAVFKPADGGPDVVIKDPAFAKRNTPRSRNAIIECTYTVKGSFPEGTFNGNGSVTLMIPGAH